MARKRPSPAAAATTAAAPAATVELGIYDSLYEACTGMGTARDRSNQIGYKGRPWLTIQEIEAAILWDGVMETFVQRPSEDAHANGVAFTKLKDKALEAVTDWLEKKTKYWEKSEEAHIAMRRTGFAAIWLNTNAVDPASPLDPAELKQIESSRQLVVLDAECMQASREGYTQYDEAPEWWTITSPDTPHTIHYSRLIIFPGRAPSRRARYDNGGKGFPEPMIIWQAWLDWLTINHVTPNVGLAFEEPTLALFELNKKMASEEGRKQVRAKLADFAATRGAFRVNAIDQEERYERIGPPLAGLADIYDRSAEFLVAKSQFPFSILFGKLEQQGGMGGTGATQGELQQWARYLARQWRKFIRPAAVQFLELSKAVLGEIDTTFKANPFYQRTEAEDIALSETESKRDVAYFGEGVITRRELRQHLAKKGTYAIDPDAVPDHDPYDPAIDDPKGDPYADPEIFPPKGQKPEPKPKPKRPPKPVK